MSTTQLSDLFDLAVEVETEELLATSVKTETGTCPAWATVKTETGTCP